jgi:predicted Rossmann fold flavoprotein
MLKDKYHTIIIGAGPAGLAAAISSVNETLIIEKNRIAGKKLLLSGLGMCNITNNLKADEFLKNCGEFSKFLKPSFYNFDNHKLIDLLEENGCSVVIRSDGKAFPETMQAVTVRDTLLDLAKSRNVIVGTSLVVKQIQVDHPVFVLEIVDLSSTPIQRSTVKAEKLIIATGGCNYPQTGSDGSGYAFAKNLGHQIILPRPALASVDIRNYGPFRDCAGNSLSNVQVTFITKDIKKSCRGDLLFTHNGFSGDVILNNSYLLSPGDKVRITMVEDAATTVRKYLADYPKRSIRSVLKLTSITQAMIDAILCYLNIDGQIQAAHFKKKDFNKLTSFLGGAEFEIGKIQDIKSAMATAGGVDIREINPVTMESKIVKNLHFAGEVMSYSLPTGGYNVQTAFSTGWAAGSSNRT